jgi:hypothetical protein
MALKKENFGTADMIVGEGISPPNKKKNRLSVLRAYFLPELLFINPG